MFSVDNKEIYPCKIDAAHQVCHHSNYGPILGTKANLAVDNNMQSNSNYSYIGGGFTLPAGKDGRTILTGGYNFTVSEIEVYMYF